MEAAHVMVIRSTTNLATCTDSRVTELTHESIATFFMQHLKLGYLVGSDIVS